MPAIRIRDRLVNFSSEDGYVEYEGKRIDYSILAAEDGRLVIKVGELVREVNFLNEEGGTTIFHDGLATKFQLLSDRELLLQSFSNESTIHHHHTEVRAPMPGLVIGVFAKSGEVVKQGDTIVILEAMKMENEIRTSRDSKVDEIFVKVGEVVEKDQLIASLK